MNTKYLTSIFAVAVATFAAILPGGSAYATGTVGSSEFDAYCARQAAGPTVPQQSRPYRASGSSCALCHPNGNTSQFNTLGTATRTCTTTSCPTSVNAFCTNAAPTGTLSITAPAAGASVIAGTAVTFTASGATDPDGFALTYSWTFSGVSGPPATATGTSVTVTPASAGTLTATLQVSDPNGAVHATRPTRSVTVTAAPQNQAPNGSITAPATIVQGQAVTFTGSGTDPDNNLPLTYAWSFGANATPATSTAQNPSVTFTASGTHTVTLTVRDGSGLADPSPASLNVSVAAPAAPVANGDSYSVQSGQTLSVAAPGVLGNDTNPSGTGTLSAQLVTPPLSGTLSLNANGGFSYTPAAGFSGSTTFTYRVTNGTTTSGNATVTLSVSAAPTPPIPNADSYTVQFGQVLTVAAPGVLGNDSNPAGTGTLSAQLVTGPASGSVNLNANGGFTYTPAAGFTGNASFVYRVTNGTTTSANATVTISVSAAPQPPIANNDGYTVQTGQTLTVTTPGVLGNDTNPAGAGTLSAQLVTGPTSGTLNLNANGGFTYTPAVGFTGNASFVYRVINGATSSGNATVTINVTAPPPPPPAACTDADRDGFYAEGGLCGPRDCNDNNAAVNPGAAEVCGDGIDNDCDGNVDSADKECNGTDCLARFFAKPVVISQASWGPDDGVNQLDVEGNQADPGAAVTVFNAATGALLGTTTVESTGSDIGEWEFEINTNTPPCRVRVEINGQMAERSVSNAPSNCVGAPAAGPVANADSYSVVGGTTLTVAAPGVLRNDTVTSGRTLTAAVASNPTSGTLALSANGGFAYTPAAGFTGTVTFSYRASDGTATSPPATVTITVSAPANQPPNGTIAPPASIVQGQAVTFNGTGTDPDGNLPLRYSWNFGTSGVPVSTAQNPTVTFGTAGTFTVTLTVTDSLGRADPTPHSVTVTVAPANRPPEGTILSPTGNVTIERGRSVSFRGIGSDPDGNTPLTYTWNFGTGSGVANSTLQNPRVRFNRNGTFAVTLTVRDSRGLADPVPATVTVRVVEDD